MKLTETSESSRIFQSEIEPDDTQRKSHFTNQYDLNGLARDLDLTKDVWFCHTLPIFTGLGQCPIVSWGFLLEQ